MYRLLNVNDGHEYAALVHDAYQADGELGIDFAAVTLPEEKLIRGLILNPTYGLFIEGRLVSAITLRMPWVKKPGPYGVPHLGWVSTRPEEKNKSSKKNSAPPPSPSAQPLSIPGSSKCMNPGDLKPSRQRRSPATATKPFT